MTFQESLTTVLTQKYADFSGRARRSELWWFALAQFVLFSVLYGLGRALSIFTIVSFLVGLALIVPAIAVGVRRLHDTGRSGWWILLGVIPIVNIVGSIVLLVFYVSDSNPGDNQYGPNPKAQVTPYGA